MLHILITGRYYEEFNHEVRQSFLAYYYNTIQAFQTICLGLIAWLLNKTNETFLIDLSVPTLNENLYNIIRCLRKDPGYLSFYYKSTST